MINDSTALEKQEEIISDISSEKQQELGRVASQMLDIFFQAKNLGEAEGQVPGRVWPWVRYLVWDSLKPELSQGMSKYTDVKWKDNDKFLNDLRNVAKKVTKVVPKGINSNEWRFIALAAQHQLLERVDSDEKYQITMLSLMRGPSDQEFERSFDQWAEIIEGSAK